MSNKLIDIVREQVTKTRAMAATHEVAWYSTLLAEIQAVGKNKGNRETTYDEAVAVVKKWHTAASENVKLCKPEQRIIYESEIQKLDKLLPAQITDVMLTNLIEEVRGSEQLSMKLIGQVTKKVNEKHPGGCDGKRISEMVKKMMENRVDVV